MQQELLLCGGTYSFSVPPLREVRICKHKTLAGELLGKYAKTKNETCE